jgi:hypothetical protein
VFEETVKAAELCQKQTVNSNTKSNSCIYDKYRPDGKQMLLKLLANIISHKGEKNSRSSSKKQKIVHSYTVKCAVTTSVKLLLTLFIC